MKNKGSRTKKTIINTAAGLMSRLCYSILNFAMRTVFIYTLGIQYTGVSSVFTDILTMLSLSELGISVAIATALYKPLREGDNSRIRKLMRFYKTAYRYIAVFIMIVGLALLPFLDNIITKVPDIKENIRVIFIFYIIKTAASYLLIYKSTILNADQRRYIVKLLETICQVVRYVVEMILLIITKSFMLYLVVEVAATIIQNYIVTRRAQREYPGAFEKTDEKLTKQEVIGLLKDIKGLSMYKISSSVGNSIDGILISSFIGTSATGMLASYTLIRRQIEALLRQFFTALTPSVGNLAAEDNPEKQRIIFNRVFYISFIVINFCMVGMFVLANQFITIWIGEKYVLGSAVAFVAAFDTFLYILIQGIASFRTANGLFIKGQYRPLVTSVLNIVLSLLLIQRFGIVGTIAATIICRLVTQWYDPYILYKYAFNTPFRQFYIKYWIYIGIFLSGCAITYLVCGVVSFGNPIVIFVARALCCVVIPNALVVLCTFFTSEFKYVLGMIKGKLKK